MLGGGGIFNLGKNNEELDISSAKSAPDNDIYWDEDTSRLDTSWTGSGTEGDPYLISSAEELAGLSYMIYKGYGTNSSIKDSSGNYQYFYYQNVHFKQTCNIDLSGYWWRPIGYHNGRSSENKVFSGNYDGGYNIIEGVFTKNVSKSYGQGLFGYVNGVSYENKSQIKNIWLKNSLIQGYTYSGAIIGKAEHLEIKNCVNEAILSASGDSHGGIVGDLTSSIVQNCYNVGDITSGRYNGGIVGSARGNSNTSSIITNSYNTASIKGSDYLGGVVGSASSALTIKNCFNIGSVQSGTRSAGVVGYNSGSLSISNCFYGGDCTLSKGVSNSGDKSEKIENLNSTTYAKNRNWYDNSSNWDSAYPWNFNSVWTFIGGVNDGYPVLRMFKYAVNISLNQQSGSGGTSSVAATPGSSMPSITVPSRTGYTFQGYYTGTNGSGTKYYNANGSSARSCDLSNDTTLYAYWILSNYTVTFDPNGGTYNNSTSITTKNYTYETTDTLGAATRDGYTFAGWLVTTGAGNWPAGTVYQSTTSYKNGYDNPTLTAQWTINSYTLTINPNGGVYQGGTDIAYDTRTYGSTVSVSVPTREGYIFKGWRMTGPSDGVLGNLGKQIVGANSEIGNDSFFTNGNNVNMYDNLNSGTVALIRETTSLPHSPYNTHILRISNTGETEPGFSNTFLGGFYFGNPTYANAEYISIIEAKLPVGYNLTWYTNPIGDGGAVTRWLTSQEGTGDWETYVFYLKCGASGTFGITNCFALDGPAGTAENPVNWYLSQASVYDCTGMGLNTSTIMSNLSKETTYTYGTSDTTIVAMWESDVWTRHAADSYAGGDGSAENPYQIASASQLAKLAKDSRASTLSGVYYKQTANIDLSGHIWDGIGNSSYYFRGNYNGNLHYITSMQTSIGNYIEEFSGLFNIVRDSTLKNIIIRDSFVAGQIDAGAVAGNASGAIENCIVDKVDITCSSTSRSSAGGIVGCVYSTIRNCIYRNGTIKGVRCAGGIAGDSDMNVRIYDCCDTNTTIISDSNAGSMVGYLAAGAIVTGCYGQGSVNGTATKLMYGNSSAWGNWIMDYSDNPINNGYPMQKALFWIGEGAGTLTVHAYLRAKLGFTEA